MKLRVCLVCGVIALLLTCGCTSLQGSTGSVSISSLHPGAEVFFDGTFNGNTPLVLKNVTPGVHHIRIQDGGNSSYETSLTVTAGANEVVSWVPEQVTVSPAIPVNNPVFSLQNMRGYRGGGDYITSLSYDLTLVPGAKPVNMTAVTVTLTVGNETLNPYWEITDKKYANTDDILESDETFSIAMRTPKLESGDTFTLTIVPDRGQNFTVTQTMPDTIGLDVRF